jgi:hypothetical protein
MGRGVRRRQYRVPHKDPTPCVAFKDVKRAGKNVETPYATGPYRDSRFPDTAVFIFLIGGGTSGSVPIIESHLVKFLAFVPLTRGSATQVALDWYKVIDIAAMVIVVSIFGLHMPLKWHLERQSAERVFFRRSAGRVRLLTVCEGSPAIIGRCSGRWPRSTSGRPGSAIHLANRF